MIKRAAVAGILLFLLTLPLPLLRAPSALFFLCFAPALPLALRARLPFLETLALAAALSPVLFGLVVLALITLGAGSSAVWIAASGAALCYIAWGGSLPSREPQERKHALWMAAIVLVIAVLVFYLPATRMWWRVRSDSWFHAAVFHRLSAHGLPLIDPYFSSLRLQYMYFYHILFLSAAALLRIGPFASMIFMNAVALASLALGFNFLSGLFARRSFPRLLGLWLALLGMNGLFFLFFPLRFARALFGETKGMELLNTFFSLSPPGHETASAFLSIEGNQFMLLEKFMLGTALSLTLGLVCVFLALFVTLRRGGAVRVVLMAVSLAGLLYLHLIIGAAVLLVSAAAAVAVRVLERLYPAAAQVGAAQGTQQGTRQEARRPFPVLRAAGAMAISLAVAAVYLASVLPRSSGESSARIALQPGYMVGLLSDVLAPLILLALALRVVRFRTALREEALPLVIWICILAAIAIAADLPTNNETKFSFLLYLPLAALAPAALEAPVPASTDASRRNGGRRAALVVFIAAATVPLNAIYFANAARDTSAFTVTSDERALYEWISGSTEKNAVFLEDNDIVRIPVLAGRDQYWGTAGYAKVWGYPQDVIARRRHLRDTVFSEADSAAELSIEDFVDVSRRPFYIVCRTDAPGGREAAAKLSASGLFRGVFAKETIQVYRLED
ncbi:MAG: hypothetical protein HY770_01045 [Chitinivibrionia bacterium]|nr:hypothetical protein [Chitinivibrionia bacterium]